MASDGAKVCSAGRVSFTATLRAAGIYWITYATAYPSLSYVLVATVNNGSCYTSTGGATRSTKVEILAIASANSAYTNQAFYFMIC